MAITMFKPPKLAVIATLITKRLDRHSYKDYIGLLMSQSPLVHHQISFSSQLQTKMVAVQPKKVRVRM